MIQIRKLCIRRFRSILSLDAELDKDNNLIVVCGQNNVGKTNLLRAIHLFFDSEIYQPEEDVPQIKIATGGQSVYPKITVVFFDSEKDATYSITRDYKYDALSDKHLTGFNLPKRGKKQILDTNAIKNFLDKVVFIYVDSINVFVPHLIEQLSDDMINIQYDKARFTESKKALKESYENYIDGLQEILNRFAADISGTLCNFNENWKLEFYVPKNSETFKGLISKDVELKISDSGSKSIITKGAGLQRLTVILLFFEMIRRLKNKKQPIFCIDEPDVFLHEGLQRKLKVFFDENCSEMQIFYTTHSNVFINSYNLSNVLLLESKSYEQYSTRKKKNIDVTETYLVNLDDDEGYNKICDHLGINTPRVEILRKNNILVEGDSDKKYITEFCKFFSLDVPNIIVLNGATNAQRFLEFYNSYYKEKSNYTPRIKLLLDNDMAGREVYKKIRKKTFNNIFVECVLIQNFLGNACDSLESNSTNNEMEDLVYPQVICYLLNIILEKKGLNKLNPISVCKKIHQKSFTSSGILSLCEYEKNSMNPDNGGSITLCSSDTSSDQVKDGMANLFLVQGNRKLQSMMTECNGKYPQVMQFLKRLVNFE